MDAFRAYFLSHAAFVVRAVPSSPPAEPPPTAAGAPSSGDSPPGELASSCSSKRSVRSSGAATGCSPENRAVAAAATSAAAEAATIGSDETRKAGSTAVEEEDDERDAGVKVWGAFYIKPNFPGRCSHVCNGGFITDPRRRRRGVARLMGHAFLRFAKDLGYRASYFNLVRSIA